MNKFTAAIASLAAFVNALAARIERSPSVEGVMATFTKTIGRLDHVAAHHAGHADKKYDAAVELMAQSAQHADESERATQTARKLRQLIA